MDRNDSNDFELLYGIYQMDEHSLQTLLDKYSVVITNTLRNYFIRSILILHGEELFQEATILLYETIYGYRYDCEASFATYYRNVLHNMLTNFYRSLYTYGSQYVRDIVSLDIKIGPYDSTFLDFLPNENTSFEGVYFLQQFEMAQLIDKYANRLQDEERNIFFLRIKGYSYKEIAKLLNINKKRVDNTLQKIRKQKV